MSSVKQMIPDSVRETWHTYWQSFRKAEAKALGDDDISDKMEMATWGVEKAEERNRANASECYPSTPCRIYPWAHGEHAPDQSRRVGMSERLIKW